MPSRSPDAAKRQEPLPTEPDPRLVCYRDYGSPGPVATNIFCAACVALSLVAVGWIIWTVAHAF